MKKWGYMLLVAVMIAAATLACGFPLPAGTEVMQTSKTVCANAEAPESCQARQDAYQMMSKLQSVVVPDLEMSLTTVGSDEDITINIKGSYEYVVTGTEEGLGANVHAKIESGTMVSGDGTEESLDNVEFILIGTKGYSTKDGGKTWTVEELDENAISGLGMMLGVTGPQGAALDLYNDPSVFTVTVGEPVEFDGQSMQVQVLALDLGSLLASSEAMTAMMESSMEAGSELGMSEEELGMSPEDIAMMSAFLLPMMAGTEANTTLHIGAEDGLIYYVEDSFSLQIDMSSLGEGTDKMSMVYTIAGHLTQHNAALTITEPTGATEGPGIFSEEGGLFGSGGGLGNMLGGTE